MITFLGYLLPYEFSPAVLLLCAGTGILYVRGLLRRKHAGTTTQWPRILSFLLGLFLLYAVLQTHFDYMAQHMFFMHRLQHLVLHHIAPFLIVLALPGPVLSAGLPDRARNPASRIGRWWPLRTSYRIIQQPVVATLLFVGLIYLWLTPVVHFYSMLNVPLYNTMNWSMAIEGLLFWYLMLNTRTPAEGGLHYAWRLLILVLVIFPQIAIGAYLALTSREVYPIYSVCGRLWPISPITDQHLGGLITWIPSAMMSAVGALVLIRRWMNEENEHASPARPGASYA